MKSILDELKGGDRRSIRGVPEVVRRVTANPSLFPTVFEGLTHADALVRMRCADAVEKITLAHPEYLSPYKRQLMQLAAGAQDKEVRWHLAQMLPRLPLNARERRHAVELLNEYLTDESRIVKTFAMQALADIAGKDPGLRRPIIERLRELTRDGSSAMKSRGRKLLARLDGSDRGPAG
jgi:HEAT repeat protein